MKQLDRLVLARKKIEQGWCKGSYAKDSQGNKVVETSPDAVSWCAIGAMHSTDPGAFFPITKDHPLCMASRGFRNITYFNDDPRTTKQDVLDLFDRAIKIAKNEAIEFGNV